MPSIRAGIDLVDISRLNSLRPEVRQRFLQRVFTPLELEQVGRSDASLAGRFAVKEAVAKALGTGIGALGWKQIEVERGPRGEPILHLRGAAKAEAERQGWVSWTVSISHTHGLAVAVVVALGQG